MKFNLTMEGGIDLGLDLGTQNIVIYRKGKGIILNEASLIASRRNSGQVLAVGNDAAMMHEKIHPGIVTTRPIQKGVIADYDATIKLIKGLFRKVKPRFSLGIRRMFISIPLGITEVEKRAVYDAAAHIGARDIYLISKPIAAAIGTGLNPFDATGNMIVDIGAGTTEIAVISLGGIVSGESLDIAGNEINDIISRYIRDEKNLAISETSTENIKKNIDSIFDNDNDENERMIVSGLNIESGLPEKQEIDSEMIRRIIALPIGQIIGAIKKNLEELVAKPDLAVDIMQNGIFLTGGGALLKGLDKKINAETKLGVNISEEPLGAVANGIGIILEDLAKYRPLLDSRKHKRHKIINNSEYNKPLLNGLAHLNGNGEKFSREAEPASPQEA